MGRTTGTWSYIGSNIQNAVWRLKRDDDPLRRALGDRLMPFADALERIENNDGADEDHQRQEEAELIKAALLPVDVIPEEIERIRAKAVADIEALVTLSKELRP